MQNKNPLYAKQKADLSNNTCMTEIAMYNQNQTLDAPFIERHHTMRLSKGALKVTQSPVTGRGCF